MMATKSGIFFWKAVSAVVLGVFVACFPSVGAWAHKVNVFAYAEGGTVFVESYFPDGSPVVQGTVSVTDPKGAKIFEGTTDKEGRAQFPAPSEKTDLTIEVNASMGHRAVATLKKSDL
ncbi:MAG: hypothetical protein WHS86_09340 [Desulfosoma sp.]